MNDHEHELDYEGKQSQEDSAVEITDLEMPEEGDENNAYLLPARKFLAWQRSLSRRQVRLATALGLLLLVSLVVLLSLQTTVPLLIGFHQQTTSSSVRQPLPVAIRPSASILPQNDGIVCVADVAWSKDSRFLAVIGYQKSCTLENDQYEPGFVGIYNALSGHLVAHFQPDGIILSALRTRYPQVQGTPIIFYNHILFSLNQQRIALTFSIFNILQPATARISTFYGVLLTNRAGLPEEILLQPQKNNTTITEWDLARGIEIDAPVIASGATLFAVASPATFTYMWNENGSLYLGAQKSGFSKSLYDPVGTPIGVSSFSLWQPGSIELTTQTGNGRVHLPGAYIWNSYFAAWSPNERYLFDTVYVQGRFEITGQPQLTHQALVDLHVEDQPLLPIRDAALLHILETMTGAPDNLSEQLIAWRPDGLTLAQYDSGTVDLDLFDCTTGFQVASLLLPTNANTGTSGYNVLLRWSPDGTHLLLFDRQFGSIVLWHISRTV